MNAEPTVALTPFRSSRKAAIVAALPRSPLHVRLLIENAGTLDVVFYRDVGLHRYLPEELRQRALFLGREQRWPSAGSIRAVRAANKAYYRHVAATLRQWAFCRLILFLESEPLESSIMDVVPPERIELWEEGLGHYCALHSPWRYALRASAQLACGFYPGGLYRRRADRRRFAAVRDRFIARDLVLSRHAEANPVRHDAFLFVGAPLVKDGWMSWRRYLWALEQIVCRATRPVVYYPHPREDVDQVKALEANFGERWFKVLPNEADVAVHCRRNKYHRYLSAFSTALLELGSVDDCAYLARLFGLARVHRELSAVEFLPCRVIADWKELGDFLAMGRLSAQGTPVSQAAELQQEAS